ncbi:MAG: hypothetical protein PUP92_39015 [Rhizonema sp. PD38]|nr:hypothetical protein [Rhizonema sp. PD38]
MNLTKTRFGLIEERTCSWYRRSSTPTRNLITAEEISQIINNHQFYSLSTYEVERLALIAQIYRSKTNRHIPAFC